MTIDITDIKARFDHESAKKSLKEKYQAKMIFAHAEGMWKAGPELLAVLQSVGSTKTLVLSDIYENPVEVNVKEFKALVLARWQEQMNFWHNEYQKILTAR